MELDVGYGLIRLVDRKQGGDLLDRITNLRRQVAQELEPSGPLVVVVVGVALELGRYRPGRRR